MIDICACSEECSHDLRMTWHAGDEERCPPIVIGLVHGSAMSEQHLHDLQVASATGNMEGCHATEANCIHSSAVSKQRLHHLQIASFAGVVERLPPEVGRVQCRFSEQTVEIVDGAESHSSKQLAGESLGR